MKKRIYSILAMVVMAAMSVTLLAACGGGGASFSGEGTAYGIVHGHYVGVSTVKVSALDKVTDVTFDEYHMPYDWAKIKVADNSLVEGSTTERERVNVELTEAQQEVFGAPYAYDPIEGHVVDFEDGVYEVEYFYRNAWYTYAEVIRIGTDYYALMGLHANNDPIYVKAIENNKAITSDTMIFLMDDIKADFAAYITALKNNNIGFPLEVEAGTAGATEIKMEVEGEDVTIALVKDSATVLPSFPGAINKGSSESTYSASWGAGEGWTNNVNAMIAFAKANGLRNDVADFTRDTANGNVWTLEGGKQVADGEVKATLTDFPDYYHVMQQAYFKAIMK